MITLLSVGLLGCYKDFQDLAEINLQDIPFENPDLEAVGAQVSTFTADLDCPDGEPATFFAVYPVNSTPSRIAIVFHSGAFDYQDFTEEVGFHSPSRMNQQWAREKVWDTLGMNTQTMDPSEINTGALATALLDANVVQLYPANCWGDLWHNQAEATDNNYDLESFNRSGRTFAYWMTQLIQNPNFPGVSDFQIAQPFDTSEIYWIGLGNGSRAIAELLHLGVTPPTGILLDAPLGSLQPYREEADSFVEHNKALDRIFIEDCTAGILESDPSYRDYCFDAFVDGDGDGEPVGEDCNDNDPNISSTATPDIDPSECLPKETNIEGIYTINGILPASDLSSFSFSQTEGGVERLAVLWSDGDSQIPQDAIEDVLLLDEDWASDIWSYNTHQIGHIFSNRDINASRQIVSYLIDGTSPTDPLFTEEPQE